jgi:hypothetical protein
MSFGRELEEIFQKQNVSRYSLQGGITTAATEGQCGWGRGQARKRYLDGHDEKCAEVQTLRFRSELALLQKFGKVRVLFTPDHRLHRQLVVFAID